VKGLKVYHIEATSNMDGTDVFQATLIAVANKKIHHYSGHFEPER
jgi:hypothetical protein